MARNKSRIYDPGKIEKKWPQSSRSARLRGKQEYDPSAIEGKWQKKWEESRIFSPDLDRAQRPYYNLMMFPYPSAEGLHVGNMYAFTGADIWGRYQRMRGKDVFQPIGLDGFGIHSENYAIKEGVHPATLAKKTQKRFYEQLHATGNAYDWKRTLETYDPSYYKWTQWLFIQMFKQGLAYRAKASVNWCPSCKTVLADEQVVGGECERCSSRVELKKLEQWFFRITDYADRLLANLDRIDWPEKIKNAQRNWIGRSEGAEIRFPLKLEMRGERLEIPTFTTRPDTLFGATFMVLSPESDWVDKVTIKEYKQKVTKYIKEAQNSKLKARNETVKTGVFTGSYAVNPATREKIPIWVADYVVGGYGSGAIMGVPAHDARDYEFAKKYDLPIKKVIRGGKLPYTGYGEIVDSGDWSGWKTPNDMKKVISWLEKKKIGKKSVSYHLRDWLISRQRYWGPPIPMIYCGECAKAGKGERKDMPGWYTVPEEDLPVKLPYIKNYQPKGTGEAPLAQDPSFVRVNCPGCGAVARRETDVSDTFLDSSWYFFRYIATDIDKAPFPSENWKSGSFLRNGEIGKSADRVCRWLPVHMYIGGAEHSVLHLMYARFVTMAFHDWGLIDFEEPFSRFYAHGLLIAEGAKMSKSRGNVVVPDEYIKKYGADTLRAYLMFLGPFDQGGDFRDTGIEGMHRFLNRVWRLVSQAQIQKSKVKSQNDNSKFKNLERVMHKTIKKVTEDIENLRFNTAVAALMEYVNELKAAVSASSGDSSTFGSLSPKSASAARTRHPAGYALPTTHYALRTLVLLLAPFAPHMAEELFQFLRNPKSEYRNSKQNGKFISVHLQPWPSYSEKLAQEELVEIPVQVNGRLRATIKVSRDEAGNQQTVESAAKSAPGTARHLKGKKVKKVVFIPGRLINFVTM